MANTQHKEWLAMPIAVVVAGAFVGGGVYFGLSSGGTAYPANGGPQDFNQVADAGNPIPAVDSNIEVAEVTSKDHVRGNKDAEVIVVEYSDTECPFCKMFHGTMKEVMAKYQSTGDVAWVYRHYPIDQLHRKARKEAEATECAAELGGNQKFWDYIDRLFEVTTSNDGLAESELSNIAEYVGLNRASFDRCLASGKHAAKVQAQFESGQAAGVNGTPHSVVITPDGNIPVNGAVSFADMERIIQNALGK